MKTSSNGHTSTAELLRQTFAGREDRYAICGKSKDDPTWTRNPIRGPLTYQSIAEQHLAGQTCLGFYLLQSDSRVRCACVDIDNHDGENNQWREQTEELYHLLAGR